MKKTIKDVNIDNKTLIIRCDFNVPIKDGKILDDNRIVMSLKTINYALDHNCKIVLLSHLGRIKSEDDKKNNSLYIVSKRLEELLNKKVEFIDETRGDVLTNSVKNMKEKNIILVQNTRYEDYPDKLESGCDDKLGRYWASLGDIFINDAFGTCHRKHASNVGISKYIPSAVGFLVEKELYELSNTLSNPKRPYVVIMGGAKVNDKIKVIDKLIKKCDYLLVGGGIANTFLKSMGYDLKKSIYDDTSLDYCKNLLEEYKDKIILPVDGYSSTEYKDNLEVKYSMLNEVPENCMVLDIGPLSIELFSKYIKDAKTVFYNGPVGVSEFKNFEYGTKNLLELLNKSNADVIIGGGDSAAAAIRFGYKDKFKHISTGGGASLELIEGKKLPAIEAIDDK
ncbi:MAG: phosphoglycerate kinase [Tenericutes bacterium]|nr:phosphoglycerate kinase [Mycoplasmatota bacterium]